VTGEEYEISLLRLILLRASYPISYLLYGILIALVLNILMVQREMIIYILVVAYALEFILRFTNKLSGVKILFGACTFIILSLTLLKIIRDENTRSNDGKTGERLVMDIPNAIERALRYGTSVDSITGNSHK